MSMDASQALARVQQTAADERKARDAHGAQIERRNRSILTALDAGAGQVQIAYMAGISQATVSKIERARKEGAK